MKNLLLFLISMTVSLFGIDIKNCLIADCSKHEANQRLFKSIIEEELANLDASISAEDKVHHLMTRISAIASQLLKGGFAIDAYGAPEIDQDTIASYYSFPLWEGESLPATFFAYVWPSEESILAHHPFYVGRFPYGTKIHSHPIPCAFAVLEGVLFQNNYERAQGRAVRYIGEESFNQFEGALDLLEDPFIHQVYTKGSGTKPAISLHAYGLASEKKVRKCFMDSTFTHYFDDVVD